MYMVTKSISLIASVRALGDCANCYINFGILSHIENEVDFGIKKKADYFTTFLISGFSRVFVMTYLMK